MNVPPAPRRAVATAATLALGIGLAVALPATATAAPGIGSDAVDYHHDVYPSLREGSVFETVTYERFEYLLDSDGTYAFLIGGPADPTTQATIDHIDAVAQDYGVDTIYNFDPRLDGADVDIRTSPIEEVGALWTNLVTNYLDKDTETSFADADAAPYLVIYDRSHTADGAEDRIVAALGGTVSATDLSDPAAVDAYRAEVADVFGSVATGEGSDATVDVSTISLFDFYRTQYNSRHASAYRGDPNYGGDILGPEDADFRIQQLTYPELVNILQSDGEYVIFFGGTWCHNTRAVVKEINQQAAAHDVPVVYNFDLRLDGLSGNGLHIRDTRSPLAHLYGDLVSTYLPNLETQYQLDSPNANHQVAYHPGGDTSVPLENAPKLQVPFLLQYDRDNVADGAAAPVTRGWIGENADGGPREYMTEWWFVNELPGYTTDPDQLATQYAFANEAIAQVETFFAADATAPTAPAAPTIAAAGSDVTVSWTAPADNGSAITGYQVSLNGGAPVELAGDVLSHTFTELPAGEYTATVTAVNEVGASPVSAPSAAVSVVAGTDGEDDDVPGGPTPDVEDGAGEDTTADEDAGAGPGTPDDPAPTGAVSGAATPERATLSQTGLSAGQLFGLLALAGTALAGGGSLLAVRHRRAVIR
ncbi:fibronectin type III domain-containing protein [Georgenia sp. MJ170]|uniref:fibronectin type III domain-containing protein n=1 Tax=Georgenia sunbinii TaxID=3117728 RepID=UPI002F269A0C